MNNSQLTTKLTGLLFPFIVIFGFYIIANGHITPGGGFQGGAVIAAVFVTRYFSIPFIDLKLSSIRILEKIFFLAMILFGIIYVFAQMIEKTPILNELFLIVMNSLIGMKVACSITIIFFRFMFFEKEQTI